MRYCENDTPEVWEAEGGSWEDLFRQAAELLSEKEVSWVGTVTGVTDTAEPLLTLYLHA